MAITLVDSLSRPTKNHDNVLLSDSNSNPTTVSAQNIVLMCAPLEGLFLGYELWWPGDSRLHHPTHA